MFEKLENRQLFAVTVSLDSATGVLNIVGDAAANNIEVRQEEADQLQVVDVAGSVVLATFIDSGVNAIRFEGGAGDDRFSMRDIFESANLTEPATMFGGTGNDTLSGAFGDDVIDGGAGNDTIDGGFTGNDTLLGGAGADSLSGRQGDDFLDGGFGRDTITGGGGTDVVDYSARSVRVTVDLRSQNGQAIHGELTESDTLSGIEDANGGAANDILIGNGSANRLRGNAGRDKIKGLGGDDRLVAGAGNDSVFGGAGADRVNGNDGDDLLSGDAGNDTLDGDAGNDILVGGTGADAFFGGAGNDFIFAQDGAVDSLNGGAGTDAAERDGNDVSIQSDVLEEVLG
jgi:Ca2+-binding RTX toxin-like protein